MMPKLPKILTRIRTRVELALKYKKGRLIYLSFGYGYLKKEGHFNLDIVLDKQVSDKELEKLNKRVVKAIQALKYLGNNTIQVYIRNGLIS